MIVRKFIVAATVAFTVGLLGAANAAASVLSDLEDQAVNKLEFGLFKVRYFLEESLANSAGSRIEGSDLTFRGFGVRLYEDDNQIIIAGAFSSRWDEELTRGACTDALSAFQRRVIRSGGGAVSGSEYMGVIFGSLATRDDMYTGLLESVHLVAILQNDDGEAVISCKSNIEGRELEFKSP